jgi:phage-related protein
MSGGGLKVGDVYVVVTAAVGEFTRSMRQIVDDVARTAGKVEQLGNKIGEIGAIVSVGLYGALAAAAAFDSSVTERMDRIKLVFQNVGAAIGDAVLPHLERLSDVLERALGWFQQLDPTVKQAIGSFLFWGTAIGLAGGGVGKLAGIVKQLAESFNAFVVPALAGAGNAVVRFSALVRGIAPEVDGNLKKVAKGAEQIDASFAVAFRSAAARILIVGAPLAAVALAVVGVVMLAGTLYKAWHDSSTGMREAFVSVWKSVTDVAGRAAKFFQDIFAGLASIVGVWARGQLDAFAYVVRNLARMAAPLARALSLDGIANTLDGLKDLSGEQILGGLKGLVTDTVGTLKNGLSTVWDGVSYGAGYAFDGVKMLGSDAAAFLRERFGGVFDDLLGGPKGKLSKPPEESKVEVEVGTAGKFDGSDYLKRASDTAGILERIAIRKAKELADAIAKAADEAKRALRSKFTQAFGRISELIQTFQEGMAAGGEWGGVAAVMGDLLSQSETFATLIRMATNFIQFVADVLGKVLAPVLPVLGSVFNMLVPLLQALVPVITAALQPLQAIAPSLELLGTLFQGLAPVITILGTILVALTNPLGLLAGPILKSFFGVIRVVAMGILYVVKGVGTVWNAIVGFIAGVFRTLSKVPLVGGAFDKMAQSLDSMKVPMAQVDGALNTLRNTSYDAAAANSAASVAQWQNAEATKKATDALTNVPTGFKVALARFNAQDPVTGSPATPVGASPITPSPTAPASGGNVTVGQIVVEAADNPEETARSVWLEMKREQNRRRGSGEWLPARY